MVEIATSHCKFKQIDRVGGSVDVEDLSERGRHRAVVWIGGHEIGHVFPPFLADRSLGDGVPLRFVFNFRIAEKLKRLLVKKYRVVVYSVLFERAFQLFPYRVVAFFVFGLLSGLDAHDECFANHFRISVSGLDVSWMVFKIWNERSSSEGLSQLVRYSENVGYFVCRFDRMHLELGWGDCHHFGSVM